MQPAKKRYSGHKITEILLAKGREKKIFQHFSRPRFSKNGRSCLGLFTLFHALFTLFHVKNRFLSKTTQFYKLAFKKSRTLLLNSK